MTVSFPSRLPRWHCARLTLRVLAAVVMFTAFWPWVGYVNAGDTVGGRVGWARLITAGRRWNAHSVNDANLAGFIRLETSLNMDPRCYPVHPSKLDALCLYPFVFTNDLTPIIDADSRRNLAEYLRRGGFIYVDACVSPNVTPDFNEFLREHRRLFAELLPGAEFRRLAGDHPVYNCYFVVDESEFHLPYVEPVARNRANDALYGVYFGQRMIALVSSHALQCAWDPRPARVAACQRMIVNIYVYAMTAGAEAILPVP